MLLARDVGRRAAEERTFRGEALLRLGPERPLVRVRVGVGVRVSVRVRVKVRVMVRVRVRVMVRVRLRVVGAAHPLDGGEPYEHARPPRDQPGEVTHAWLGL